MIVTIIHGRRMGSVTIPDGVRRDPALWRAFLALARAR